MRHHHLGTLQNFRTLKRRFANSFTIRLLRFLLVSELRIQHAAAKVCALAVPTPIAELCVGRWNCHQRWCFVLCADPRAVSIADKAWCSLASQTLIRRLNITASNHIDMNDMPCGF